MELDIERPKIDASANLDEAFFGISDLSIIFDILRNKMYSDPIKAVCREVSCNARDAHIEVGKGDVPIEIYLPTAFNNKFKIKDYGPGISLDRMSNVFINYAASTKRNDNTQTGGFGLGAKTPFSYSDSFSIVTVNNGVKTNYSCYIDESRVGKLVILGSEPTKEPSGTEIILPVKSNDYLAFESAILDCTKYWEVPPKFLGKKVNKPTLNIHLEGEFWKIIDEKKYNNNIIAIVDGIAYPIKLEYFSNTKIYNQIKSTFSPTLLLYFNIGELSLSANRESIYIEKSENNKSYKAIINKFNLLKEDIKMVIENKISSCKSYINAVKLTRSILYNINLYKDTCPKYKGNEIDIFATYHGITFGLSTRSSDVKDISQITTHNVSKICYSNKVSTLFDMKKIFKSNDDDYLFIYNDDNKSLNKNHALKIFKLNPTKNNIIFISMNSSFEDKSVKELKRIYPGDNIEKYFKKKKVEVDSKGQIIIYKFSSKLNKPQKSSKKQYDNSDKKVTAFCKISDHTKNFKINSVLISNDVISKVLEHHGSQYNLFAIKDNIDENKYQKILKECIPLKKLISSYINSTVSVDIFNLIKAEKLNLYKWNYGDVDFEYYTRKILFKEKELLNNTTFNNHFKAKELFDKVYESKDLLYIYEVTNGPINRSDAEKTVKKYKKIISNYSINKIFEKYPMLTYLSYYNNKSYSNSKNYNKNYSKEIIKYIKMVDEQKGSI